MRLWYVKRYQAWTHDVMLTSEHCFLRSHSSTGYSKSASSVYLLHSPQTDPAGTEPTLFVTHSPRSSRSLRLYAIPQDYLPLPSTHDIFTAYFRPSYTPSDIPALSYYGICDISSSDASLCSVNAHSSTRSAVLGFGKDTGNSWKSDIHHALTE
jgi:hypothetical protein